MSSVFESRLDWLDWESPILKWFDVQFLVYNIIQGNFPTIIGILKIIIPFLNPNKYYILTK